jgi:uncharacterized membrane protein YphA (DoxX/SURF4 family)
MKSTTLKTSAYWLTTGLLALEFAVGGAFQIARPPLVMTGMAHLGYPAYFATLLGVWKLLGAVALLVPGFPRIKEWAYAGIFFDVTSAVVSILAVGDGLSQAILPLVFVALTVASWALRPASRSMLTIAPRISTRSLHTAVDAAA